MKMQIGEMMMTPHPQEPIESPPMPPPDWKPEPSPIDEPEPDRLPDEVPLPNPDESDAPPMHAKAAHESVSIDGTKSRGSC
ncbi:hypothetical protein [Endobacterium cereale]|jgi:hypothetical protein